MTVQYNNCPICGNSQLINASFAPIDFCVSQQSFELIKCAQCTVVLTAKAPTQELIGPYYHFDNYVSHTDTQDSFFHKIYHAVRKYTINKKYQLVVKATGKKTGNLLDIGSGTGSFLAYLQSKNWAISGIEADEQTRINAQQINNINARDVDYINYLEAASFDAVTMWHVLEHVHDLATYTDSIYAALKPKGYWFIAVPNYKSYDAQYYKQHWAAYDVPRHLYHFSPKSIAIFAELNGFELVNEKPMWFDSFYVSLLSAGYKKQSKIIALFVALWSNFLALFNTRNCSSVIYVLRKKS